MSTISKSTADAYKNPQESNEKPNSLSAQAQNVSDVVFPAARAQNVVESAYTSTGWESISVKLQLWHPGPNQVQPEQNGKNSEEFH